MSGALGWNLLVWGSAALLLAVYVRGWGRLRRRGVGFATRARAGAFVAALLLLGGALAWPLVGLSQAHVLARMGQKVAICLAGAPLLWLALPLHMLAAGVPPRLRRTFAALCLRPRRFAPALRAATGPVAAWFVYIAAFLLWHDPGFVAWQMGSPARQRAGVLLLLGAALLFWQQITLGGPRRYATATPGARVAMLIGAEIPNVAAGITISFATQSLYPIYDATALNPAGLTHQQSLAGALTWVFGSLVYIASIVAVVNGIFQREGIDRPQPLLHWDAAEKFIAPGLEPRVGRPDYTVRDWREG